MHIRAEIMRFDRKLHYMEHNFLGGLGKFIHNKEKMEMIAVLIVTVLALLLLTIFAGGNSGSTIVPTGLYYH